jgi:phthiocerol/phenolphthiocerol synthesis type-I polyketide synthase E
MNRVDPRQMLKEALRELQDLRRQLRSAGEVEQEKVAIIGMGCRLATGVNGLEQVARPLPGGATETADERLHEGLSFAASFFDLDREKATGLEPHQRLLLETSWEALEHAGQTVAALPKSRTAVFIGIGGRQPGDEHGVLTVPAFRSAETVAGMLGIEGRVVNVATGYTSALTAVHLACRSLLAGESDVALAGGVTLRAPGSGESLRAAGCGVVVLKRLSLARHERDFIWAQVRGCNRPAELTMEPDTLQQALSACGITAVDSGSSSYSGYISCSGYISYSDVTKGFDGKQIWQNKWGVFNGDPTKLVLHEEEGGMGQVDSMAGLAMALKALQARAVTTDSIRGERSPAVKMALVSTFSTREQVHLVLEPPIPGSPAAAVQSSHLLLLSAKSEGALAASARGLAAHLESRPEVNLADVAYTTRAGRQHFRHRRAFLATDRERLLQELQAPEEVAHSDSMVSELTKPPIAFLFPGLGNHYLNMGQELHERQAVFRAAVERCAILLRPYLNLDLRDLLYDETGDHENGHGGSVGMDLRRMLGRDNEAGKAAPGNGAAARLQQTAVAQPLLFTIEYALAQLLQSWAIQPAAMLGYSIGEYVAAHLAGVFGLEEALFLVATRARLIQALPPGKMLAVPLSETEVVARMSGRLSLSAINGRALCVVAGEPAAVDTLATELAAEAIASRELPTTHAFHTEMMRSIGPEFVDALRQVRFAAPEIPYVSNVTGGWITADQATSPDYWLEHSCRPVRFGDGIATLRGAGHELFVEVGPGQALASLVSVVTHHDGAPTVKALPTMPYEYDRQTDTAVLYKAVAGLWLAGAAVDWERFDVAPDRRRVPLPTYPFERQLFMPASVSEQAPVDPVGPAEAQEAVASEQHVTGPRCVKTVLRSEVELKLYDIWRRVLRIGDFDPRRTFFELGGNSLLATQLIFQMRKAFQVDVSLRTIFEAPAIGSLAQVVQQNQSAGDPLLAESSPAAATGGLRAADHAPLSQECELPNGLVIACQSRAETAHFYEDIFEHRNYFRHSIDLPASATVFDVGGNIGLFTLFVHLNYPGARIFTFEPAPPIFRLLQENVARHGVRAQLYRCALSRQAGTAELTFYPQSSGMSSLYPDLAEEKAALTAVLQNQVRRGQTEVEALLVHADDYLAERFRQETFTCPVKTVSQVIDETAVERLHLLKIDVQKSEYDVLLGIREEHWSRIDQIVLEVHNVESRLHTISHLLRQKGYRVMVEQDDLYTGSAIYNVYARLKVKGLNVQRSNL